MDCPLRDMADAVDARSPISSNLYALAITPGARMHRFRVNISRELRDERPASEDPLHEAVANDCYSFASPIHRGDLSPVTVVHSSSSSASASASASATAPKSSSSTRSTSRTDFLQTSASNTEAATETTEMTDDAAFKRVVFDYFTSQFDIFLPLPLAYAGGQFAYASNGITHLPDAAIGTHVVKVNVSSSGTVIPMQHSISRDTSDVVRHAKVDLQFSDAGVVAIDGASIDGTSEGTGIRDDNNEEIDNENGDGFQALKAVIALAERIARYALKSQSSHGIRKSSVSNSSLFDHSLRDLYANALSVVPTEAPRILPVASGFAIALCPFEDSPAPPSLLSISHTDLRTVASPPLSTLAPSSASSRDPFRRRIHSVLSGLSNLARRAPVATFELPKSCTTDACNLREHDALGSRVFTKSKNLNARKSNETRSTISKSVSAMSKALKDLDYNVTMSLVSLPGSSWKLSCPRRVPRVHALQDPPLFIRPVDVENWVILADHALPHSMARSFSSSLITAASRRGIQLHQPMIHTVPPTHFATFFGTIMENFDDIACSRKISSALDVVVVLQTREDFRDDEEYFTRSAAVNSPSSASSSASSNSSAFPSVIGSDSSIVATAAQSNGEDGIELSKEFADVCQLADVKYGIPTLFVEVPTTRPLQSSRVFDSLVCRFNVIAGGYNTVLDMPPPPPPPPPPLPMSDEQPWQPPHAVIGLSITHGIAAAVAQHGSHRACAVRPTKDIGTNGSAAAVVRAIFMQLWDAPSIAIFHQIDGILKNEDVSAVERAARACGVPRFLYIGIDRSHSATFIPSSSAPSAVALETVGGIRFSNVAGGVLGDFFLLSMAGAKPCRYTVFVDDTAAPPTALHAWTLRHCYGDIPNPGSPLPVVTCVHQASALARRVASYVVPFSKYTLNSNSVATKTSNRKQHADSSNRKTQKKTNVEFEIDEYHSQNEGYTTLDANVGSIVEEFGIHPNLMPYLFYV